MKQFLHSWNLETFCVFPLPIIAQITALSCWASLKCFHIFHISVKFYSHSYLSWALTVCFWQLRHRISAFAVCLSFRSPHFQSFGHKDFSLKSNTPETCLYKFTPLTPCNTALLHCMSSKCVLQGIYVPQYLSTCVRFGWYDETYGCRVFHKILHKHLYSTPTVLCKLVFLCVC